MVDTNGTTVTVCTITATTFTSPDDDTEDYARAGLESGRSAIIMAKNPLTPGHSYRVTALLTDGESLDWTFAISTDGSIRPPAGHPLAGLSTPGKPSQVVASGKATKKRK